MGGTGYISQQEIDRRKELAKAIELEDMKRATRLAKKVIGHLNKIVIRPGPKPEERECTKVASELEAQIPTIAKMIYDEPL